MGQDNNESGMNQDIDLNSENNVEVEVVDNIVESDEQKIVVNETDVIIEQGELGTEEKVNKIKNKKKILLLLVPIVILIAVIGGISNGGSGNELKSVQVELSDNSLARLELQDELLSGISSDYFYRNFLLKNINSLMKNMSSYSVTYDATLGLAANYWQYGKGIGKTAMKNARDDMGSIDFNTRNYNTVCEKYEEYIEKAEAYGDDSLINEIIKSFKSSYAIFQDQYKMYNIETVPSSYTDLKNKSGSNVVLTSAYSNKVNYTLTQLGIK